MLRALPALLLTLTIAACGGTSAREEVIAAAQRTAEQSGLRAEVSGQIQAPGFREPLPITGASVVADSGERVRGTANLSGLAGGPGGKQLEAFADSELIEIGENSYFRFPRAGDLLPEGVEWLSVDPKAQERLGLTGGPGGLGAADPTEVLDALDETVEDVEETGSEEVRGVPTTRYGATVNISPQESDAQGIDAQVPTQIWVGEDGLVRRISQKLQAHETRVEYAVEYFDFGVQADIQRPPADVTAPFEEAFAASAG